MGTQNLKKVPMGTRVPKWGPTWEQCLCTLLAIGIYGEQTTHVSGTITDKALTFEADLVWKSCQSEIDLVQLVD